MKLLGAAMVLLGCLGMALEYIHNLEQKIQGLEELLGLLEWMESEISYTRVTLPECFLRVNGQTRSKFGNCFFEVGKKAIENPMENLKRLLITEMEPLLKKILSEADCLAFYEIAEGDGCREENRKCSSLKRVRQRLEERWIDTKELRKKRSRAAIGLGTLGGLFVILLLI